MGLRLIPLGAAALGLGVTDGSGAAVAALGLAGGASYAFGAWLSSRPRKLVYGAGIKAMTCAVNALLRLAFSPDARKAFKDDVSGLNSTIGMFSQQVARVRELLLADLIRDFTCFSLLGYSRPCCPIRRTGLG